MKKTKKKEEGGKKWKSGRRNDGERCSMLTASIIYEQGSWFANRKKNYEKKVFFICQDYFRIRRNVHLI
jgi:hypothetical protein